MVDQLLRQIRDQQVELFELRAIVRVLHSRLCNTIPSRNTKSVSDNKYSLDSTPKGDSILLGWTTSQAGHS